MQNAHMICMYSYKAVIAKSTCTSPCACCAEAPATSLLSNPKTLSTIQKILEGQTPGGESVVTSAAPDDSAGPTNASDAQEEGQLVEVKFRAAKAGKYNLQLVCMSGTPAASIANCVPSCAVLNSNTKTGEHT